MVGRFLPGLVGSICLGLVPARAADAVAPRPVSDPGPLACVTQSEGFLRERLVFWQQRLKLDDWKISIVMSRTSDLKPKTLGNIHWDSSKKVAVIRVLRATEYQLPCSGTLDDMEVTLVHELVHLELSSLPRPRASRREEEFAVNRIADALLALDRQKPVTTPGGVQRARELSTAASTAGAN